MTPTTQIKIRNAEPTDSVTIVTMIIELAASIHETCPVTEDYVRKYLTSDACFILMAEIGNQSVGLLCYSIRPDLYHAANSCQIEDLIVSPENRGQGIGSALMNELFIRADSLKCAEISVTVMPDNLRAIKFYQGHGLVDEAVYFEKHVH